MTTTDTDHGYFFASATKYLHGHGLTLKEVYWTGIFQPKRIQTTSGKG
jgi:predicted membrane protein